MNRLKFLLFAMAAVALWVGHLAALSPAVMGRAQEQASWRAAMTAQAVRAEFERRRAEVAALGLRALTQPDVRSAAGKVGKAAPDAEKLAPLRTAVQALVPEPLRPQAVVGWSTAAGMAYGRGEEPPAPEPLDLAGAGTDGPFLKEAFGKSHVFVLLPMGEEERLLVGLPALPDGVLAELLPKLGLEAAGLLSGEHWVEVAPAEPADLESLKQLAPGQTLVLARGAVAAMGPFKLPILTNKDALGGGAPLRAASRQALVGTPYEVVAAVSPAPFAELLAAYQRFALLALVGLLVATVGWVFLFREGASSPRQKAGIPTGASIPAGGPLDTLPLATVPAPPDAKLEDFAFPPPPVPDSAMHEEPSTRVAPPPPGMPRFDTPSAPTPIAEPSAEPEPLPLPPPRPPAASFSGDEEVIPLPGATPPSEAATGETDPFEAVLGSPPASLPKSDFNPEQTRVAAVPAELLQAASPAHVTAEYTMPPAELVPPPPAAPSVEEGDEAHHREVFQEFVTTREKCGEAADGLTFEKFSAKLRKNRDQLVQKYGCKTVRFQVYVKDGRAALKATPLKE